MSFDKILDLTAGKYFIFITYVFDAKLEPTMFLSDLFVTRSVPFYTLDNALSNRLLGQR